MLKIISLMTLTISLMLSLISETAFAANKWNERHYSNEYLSHLHNHKTGDVGGVPNCSATDYDSFYWSDFTPEQQQRIQNLLLHAYTTKQRTGGLFSGEYMVRKDIKNVLATQDTCD